MQLWSKRKTKYQIWCASWNGGTHASFKDIGPLAPGPMVSGPGQSNHSEASGWFSSDRGIKGQVRTSHGQWHMGISLPFPAWTSLVYRLSPARSYAFCLLRSLPSNWQNSRSTGRPNSSCGFLHTGRKMTWAQSSRYLPLEVQGSRVGTRSPNLHHSFPLPMLVLNLTLFHMHNSHLLVKEND